MPPLVAFAPTAVVVLLALGGGLLWSRTRRASSLLQFIGSGILFAGIVLEQIRWLFVLPSDQSVFANVMRSEAMHIYDSLSTVDRHRDLPEQLPMVCARAQTHLTMRWSERRTAVRSTFEMTSTLPFPARRGLVRRRSSC
jgi:hypothetical protein